MDALTGIQEGGDIYHMEVDRTTASRKRKNLDADGKKLSSKLAQ